MTTTKILFFKDPISNHFLTTFQNLLSRLFCIVIFSNFQDMFQNPSFILKKKRAMLQHFFSFSFVHVPECAHCTLSFSAMYMFQNVLIVHFLFQLCTCSRMCSLYTFFFQLCTCSGMCLLYFYVIHISCNLILSLFYTS